MIADAPPPNRTIYVTLTGLPLRFHFDWPFRLASSGSDFHVLHTDVTLENSGGLHAGLPSISR